ncbi:MAG: hypothetical protein HC836_12695 [Richelia sp. RM2_1_2]|nr:hypothetical protein [Richelia sp. RM2_1_2]
MQKKINISFLMLVCTLLFGCASKTKYVEKQSEPASQAAYAVADAIEKGRVDAAERYAQELKRLIEKPKQEIRVAEVVIPVTPQPSIIEELAQGAIKTEVQENNTNRPVELKYQKYVILPESYRDREIVIFNTEEFNALINEHENVKKLFELEKQNFSNFVKDVDKQKKINNEVQNQLIKDLERARSEAAKYKALSAKYQQYYYFFWGSITFVGMLIVLFLLIRFGKFFM